MGFPRKSFYEKTWWLNGQPWELIFVPESHLQSDPSEQVFAKTQNKLKQILISDNLSEILVLESFIHEIRHALLEFEHDLTVSHRYLHKTDRPLAAFIAENFFR